MPRTRTLLQIRDGARYLADAVNDNNITDAVATTWVNDELAELWEEEFACDPDRFLTTANISTTTGTQSYSLPSNFLSIRRVEWVNGGQRILIEPAPLLELDTSTDQGNGGGGNVNYRVMAGSQSTTWIPLIYLLPDPGTTTYRIWYVTAPVVLVVDADTFDGVAGWEGFIMNGVAAKICERQDRDSTPFRAEKERQRQRIQTMARKRDSGRAKRITDIRTMRGSWRDLPDP